jgi:hypothetical protein
MSREFDVVMLTGAEYDAIVDERDDLREALDAAKRDAERYSWLKRNARRCDFAGLCVSDGAQLDARIDAARKEK